MSVAENQFTIRVPKSEVPRVRAVVAALSKASLISPRVGDVYRDIFLRGLDSLEQTLGLVPGPSAPAASSESTETSQADSTNQDP